MTKYSEKIISAFDAPTGRFGAEDKGIIATYLKIILQVAIAVLPVYVAIKVLKAGTLFPSDYILSALFIFLVCLLFLLKNNRVFLSVILFLLIGWVSLTLLAWYADGVKDVAIVGYIIVIFLATLLAGIRFSLLITGLSIISVWVLGIAEMEKLIIPIGDDPLNMSRDYTVLLILVLTAILLFARSYRYSLNRLNRELQERIKAEEKLSKNEKHLIEKNEELMFAKDKAEESDRLKTAFIHNISHEIRTPMNGIVGFAELLRQPETDSEKKAEYISIINSCTSQLASLINDLIDISRIESGTVELKLKEFEPSEIINDVEAIYSKRAAGKGLLFKIENNLDDLIIISDEGKLRQILDNIVSNAIKFTDKGYVKIVAERENNNFVFTVSDTGIGIKDSDQNEIFGHFRQLESGLERTYGGSGLGLSISKGYIDLLGGKIRVESKPGSGSKFTFSVPFDLAAQNSSERSGTSEFKFNRKIRILAAEDDDISLLFIKELFRDCDCEIISARNGNEAVELFSATEGIDIVLMDIKMPHMNGYEATRKIKNINPRVPVLAITSFGLKDDLMNSSGITFDDLIEKPVNKPELLSKIFKLIN
jgi:signal transduction histidine kinase